MAADGGHGATIAFSTGFLAEITAISHSGYSRGVTETTHSTSTSGWRTFQPSDLKDMGELEVTLRFEPDSEPPLTGAAETGTITFPFLSPGTVGAKLSGSMFLTNFQYSLDCIGDDAMEATATLKWSGAPTWTDQS